MEHEIYEEFHSRARHRMRFVYIYMPSGKVNKKMNVKATLFVFIILIGCSQDNRPDNIQQNAMEDSLAPSTLGHREQATWDYFQELEVVLRENDIPESKIEEHVQALIDQGVIPKPEVFIDTNTGTTPMIVDYKAYKKFRQENPIDLERHYTFIISLESDTNFRDSIRNGLIEALEGEGVD